MHYAQKKRDLWEVITAVYDTGIPRQASYYGQTSERSKAMTDPATEHVMAVFVGTIAIIIAMEVFIAIRESKKRNKRGEKDDK